MAEHSICNRERVGSKPTAGVFTSINSHMEILLALVVFLAALLFFSMIMAFPVMWLWNWLMPVIFGLPTLTFWQSLGLLTLCSFLFKTYTVNNKK